MPTSHGRTRQEPVPEPGACQKSYFCTILEARVFLGAVAPLGLAMSVSRSAFLKYGF